MKIYHENDFEKEGQDVDAVSKKIYRIVRMQEDEKSPLRFISLNRIKATVKETFDYWNN
tara:strand:- start:195 stop:371 length:177 start_codon:yes stop_codon:yes gene_type:complete